MNKAKQIYKQGRVEQGIPQKDRRLRIIWNANSVWSPSGYGVHMKELLYALVNDGWPTAMIAYYGLEGTAIDVNGLKVYPKMGDPWGADGMIYHSADFHANVVFSMMDVWVLDPNKLKQLKIPWIPYTPIDHSPPPPVVLDRLRFANRIISFSKFGQKELEKAGFYSDLILEGTNTQTFQPMGKKENFKKGLGINPELFLFGMVGANKDNPPRKCFQHAMDAFKMFHDSHPKSGLFIHTLLQQAGGFPIRDYARYLGIDKFLFSLPDYAILQKSDHTVIAKEMNAFDVLLQPSCSEGFGLPIIEAMSCGVPVITTNFTAMPEHIIPGKTGELIKVQWKRWTPIQGYIGLPDTTDLYNKMEKLYKNVKENGKQIAKDCREHILTNYDNEVIIKNKWIPYLESLQEELLGKPKK